MSNFAESYLGRLRDLVGPRLLLVPGARVVIENDDSEVLLELRSDFRLWGLPGGVPDEDENLVACAVREVREETGLTIVDPSPFGFASDPLHEVWTYPNGDRCHYFTLLLAADRYHGALAGDSSENIGLSWFSLDALPEMMPVMARTLAAYGRWKVSGSFQVL